MGLIIWTRNNVNQHGLKVTFQRLSGQLGPCQISKIEHNCENSYGVIGVNCFREKAPLKIFNRALKTP